MREKSCGAVVYTKENDIYKFLIIKQTNDVWGFPKGHVEKGETEEETAKREIREETNLDVDIDINFREVITYVVEATMNTKDTVFFIGQPKTNDVKLQETELIEYNWLEYEDALNRLTYYDTRKVLEKAYKYLLKK